MHPDILAIVLKDLFQNGSGVGESRAVRAVVQIIEVLDIRDRREFFLKFQSVPERLPETEKFSVAVLKAFNGTVMRVRLGRFTEKPLIIVQERLSIPGYG